LYVLYRGIANANGIDHVVGKGQAGPSVD